MTASSWFALWIERLSRLNDAGVVLAVVVILAAIAAFAWLLRPRTHRRISRTVAIPETKIVAQSSEGYPMFAGSLLADAAADFLDVQRNGVAWRATMLREHTRIPVIDESYPRYFTGQFDAPIVIVHVMPKFGSNGEATTYRDFDDYLDRHRTASADEDSALARRTAAFTRAFTNDDARTLELYFVPYPALPFDSRKLNGRLFRREYDRVMDVINAFERDYIIFCGAAFDRLLAPYTLRRQDDRFRLPTQDGISKSEYRFSSIVLRSRQRLVRAGVAQSFALRTTPLRGYGSMCRDRYDAPTGSRSAPVNEISSAPRSATA